MITLRLMLTGEVFLLADRQPGLHGFAGKRLRGGVYTCIGGRCRAGSSIHSFQREGSLL